MNHATGHRRLVTITLIVLPLLASAIAAPRASRADLVYFRQGGDAQIPVTTHGTLVGLVMPDGIVELPSELIRARVPGFWPESEWPTRLEKARKGTVADRYAGIWWGIENGLTTEVTDEIRALHALDPNHAPAARMAAALDRLEQPCAELDFSRFRKALGVEMQVARGPHVILLHQHAESEALERLALLERVIRGYLLSFAAQGIELPAPRHKLVSAWFAEQSDYRAFLHTEHADVFSTTRGYFHPTWNAVVTFDARGTDQQKEPRARLVARQDGLTQYRKKLSAAPRQARIKIRLGDQPARTVARDQADALINRVEGEIRCETMLLDLDRRSVDLGTAAHEMIHQLASDTGLYPRHDAFPHWLHEGLAAQFEVIRGGRWAGISRAHDLRLPDWRRLAAPAPLERLVRDAGFGHGYQRDIYAQAWALVYYLRTQHSAQFLTFLDLLRSSTQGTSAPAPASPTSDRVFHAFERAFGPDLAALERDWHQFMQTVRTPLEQNAPPPEPTTKKSRLPLKAKT